MSDRCLIVLPDESAQAIFDAIAGAKKSLRIKMFVFSDPALLGAVIGAHERGVNVRVMLNSSRRSGEATNTASRRVLEKAGVTVNNGNPAFKVTHEKSMVADDAIGFVTSLNWATENLTKTRDYAVCTTHPHEVREIVACFEADWHRHVFTPGEGAHLIWCPSDGRERLARFIDDARHTLFVQNERYQDAIIIERLVRAKARGVKVHVMARPPHTLKRTKLIEGVGGLRILDAVGIRIQRLTQLKLHGKMLLADGARAIVGSINLAPGSFDTRRELAIELADDDIVERLHKVARHDWKHSHELDLSDDGLRRDLEDRVEGITEKLALDVKGEHAKTKKKKQKT